MKLFKIDLKEKKGTFSTNEPVNLDFILFTVSIISSRLKSPLLNV